MAWLDDLVDQHKELEAPLSFWKWAGLCVISAVLKDNVWLDQHLYKVYPNIYVMLHAKSGLRKGPPINMAHRLVDGVNNTRIYAGRSSIQGILKDMGTAYTQPGGIVINKANAFICSSELTSSIVEDKVATDILMDLYDRNYRVGKWRSLLKSETFNLEKPTITMLTATNESHSEDFFAKKDIQGGYFARTFIIYEEKINRINSLVIPSENPPNDKILIPYLQELAKLKGEFIQLGSREKTKDHIIGYGNEWFTEAGKIYHDWYNKFKKDTMELEDETGTLNRFGDSVLKVAMLLSLSKKPVLNIDAESIADSINLCEKLLGSTRRVTMGKKGKSTYANQKVMIIEKLLKREPHEITRAQLMMDMHYHLNSSELDEIMKGFDESGLIKIELRGNVGIYVMPEHQVQKLKDWMEGKK